MKIWDKKIQRFHSSHGEQNKRTTRPQGRKLNMNHVATKKITEAKLKKKHSELMTLAGLPRAGAISKPHDYKQKVQKKKNLPKN